MIERPHLVEINRSWERISGRCGGNKNRDAPDSVTLVWQAHGDIFETRRVLLERLDQQSRAAAERALQLTGDSRKARFARVG